MWNELPSGGKNRYKRLVLGFASLTEMFAQKSDELENATPIINSKFQETAFQKAFNAFSEDIKNTPYDASLQYNGNKYLVGIKTFGLGSGDQKIAQFKAKHNDWSTMIDEIQKNAKGINDKDKINELNNSLYSDLAKEVATVRNERIDSAVANIRGFKIDNADKCVHSVYHVLMPASVTQSKEVSTGEAGPKIFVGETSYDRIDIDNIEILGCTSANNPTNILFSDGKHRYKFTSADSQLLMNFNNKDIICDEWNVVFADKPYEMFEKMTYSVYSESMLVEEDNPGSKTHLVEYQERMAWNGRQPKEIEETYCWTIWNKNGDVEKYSGFNSFYGIGSKMGRQQRVARISSLQEQFDGVIDERDLTRILEKVSSFLLDVASSASEKAEKERLRDDIVNELKALSNTEFKDTVIKMLYRPMDEMYIPLPNAGKFHAEHPDFFGKDFGKTDRETKKLVLPKEGRVFNLVFEPSGDSLPVYITQDDGKAIESYEKQTYLGQWILRGVFQLGEYEPLTAAKLAELSINGLRLTKYKGSDDIHLEFIWIDEDNPPKGYIEHR